MTFTSIKVRLPDKRLFDRLRHEWALQTGEEVSQHELFHRILEHALRSKKDLVREGRPRRSWKGLQFELGEPTDATRDLDRVVYGS